METGRTIDADAGLRPADGTADAQDGLGCTGADRRPDAPAELFVSDPHGEYEAFAHILRGACGGVRAHVEAAFPNLGEKDKNAIANLVCYPLLSLDVAGKRGLGVSDPAASGAMLLATLVRHLAIRRSPERVKAVIPQRNLAPITFLAQTDDSAQRRDVIEAVARKGAGDGLVEDLAKTVQGLARGKLHMVGDVYDRGPAPDLIMEELMACDDVDIQWGNHDIVWMGAALGQRGCISHVVRNCARYGNLPILEQAYGFDLTPLYDFALEAYRDDPCVAFGLKVVPEGISPEDLEKNIKVQKAMAIMQFKVEAACIDENPGFGLADRKLLHRIDFERNTVVVDGVEYPLADTVLPTVDPADPYRLTDGEEAAMSYLQDCFTHCEKLQRHMSYFLEKGSLYTISGKHLIFHACVPLNSDGSLKEVNLFGETFKGKALFDAVDRHIRNAFLAEDERSRKRGRDLLWYLWLGEGSPLFAKSKMATFEIYMIADKAARKEIKNPFYTLVEDEAVVRGIFEDFGMDPDESRIVCGHVPVKVKNGEDPVKCGGKVVFIDGGMSRAYQPTTGIAGFTLIADEEGDVLATHRPFESAQAAVERAQVMESEFRRVDGAQQPAGSTAQAEPS